MLIYNLFFLSFRHHSEQLWKKIYFPLEKLKIILLRWGDPSLMVRVFHKWLSAVTTTTWCIVHFPGCWSEEMLRANNWLLTFQLLYLHENFPPPQTFNPDSELSGFFRFLMFNFLTWLKTELYPLFACCKYDSSRVYFNESRVRHTSLQR